MRLEGRRVLVVGASAGIGRAIAEAASASGARVAVAARRAERLDEVAAGCKGEAVPIVCDVRDPASCESSLAGAVAALGGLDALVYSPGIGIFARLEDVDAETWRAALEVNLIGAALTTRAAIGHLEASGGKALYLSSIATTDQPPREAFGTYIVSKVALDRMIEVWQGEHRGVSFTRLVVGDAITEFAAGVDPASMGHWVQRWVERGYLYGRVMDVSSIADQAVSVLASPETVRVLTITPRFGE